MKENRTNAPARGKKTVIRIAVLALVGLIFGLMIYNINARNLVGNKMPMPLGFGTSVVISGSMEPELSVNDLIIVTKTDELYVGQVVVFQSGSSLVVHRIIGIDGDEIRTQGDANNTADDPITRDMIKGEVAFAIPFVGVIIDMIQSPIVSVSIIAIALYMIERSYRAEKADKEAELEQIKHEIDELKKN